MGHELNIVGRIAFMSGCVPHFAREANCDLEVERRYLRWQLNPSDFVQTQLILDRRV